MGWTLSRPPLCRVIIDLQQTSGHQLHLATATKAAVGEKLFLFKMAFSFCTPSFVLAIAAARIIVVVSDTSFRWRRRSALSLSLCCCFLHMIIITQYVQYIKKEKSTQSFGLRELGRPCRSDRCKYSTIVGDLNFSSGCCCCWTTWQSLIDDDDDNDDRARSST